MRPLGLRPELPLTVPPKPLLRGWLQLAWFEASLVLRTLMTPAFLLLATRGGSRIYGPVVL